MTGEMHLDFTADRNGHKASAPGNLGFNQIELHRIDKHQAEVRELKDGAPVAIVRENISNDGKELTSTTTTAGHLPQVTVWTRSGGAKDSKDPFRGNWTQDLSKTRMRQASQLKIESDGNGGVRFEGDYSYTAHLDAKPYAVRNSRNDTVQLATVDSHTIDATFLRDNQVAQRERWQVNADGEQMTCSSSATTETGQRVNEKLFFKKQ